MEKIKDGLVGRSREEKQRYVLLETKRIKTKLSKTRRRIKDLKRLEVKLETILRGLDEQTVRMVIEEYRHLLPSK